MLYVARSPGLWTSFSQQSWMICACDACGKLDIIYIATPTPSLPHPPHHCHTHSITATPTPSLPHPPITATPTPSLPHPPHYCHTHPITATPTPSLPHPPHHCHTHPITATPTPSGALGLVTSIWRPCDGIVFNTSLVRFTKYVHSFILVISVKL